MTVCALETCENELKHSWSTYCSTGCANRAHPRRQRKCRDGISRCSDWSCHCQTRPVGTCAHCGEPKMTRRGDYCSGKCAYRARFNTDQRLAEWLAGETSADGSGGRDRAGLAGWARTYLLEEADWSCMLCGWNTPNPKSGLPPLEIDHKDGNRRNNYRSNVWVLCPNCHALQPTNKGMNRNKYKDFPL